MKYSLPLKYVDAVARTRSIRAAAEHLAITPSALNRRILAMEDELGVEIFERSAQGVRLNSAGEIFIQHVRTQLSDLERVRSRIADLKGVRSGVVRIAATRASTRYFLPDQIQLYRQRFPGVSFEVKVVNRSEAEEALAEFKTDIAIILDSVRIGEFQSLLQSSQTLHALVSSDHPLAGLPSVRLYECLDYELLMPPRGDGVREMLERATSAKGLTCHPIVESNDHAMLERLAADGGGIAFSISLDISDRSPRPGLQTVPIDIRDVKPGLLFVGQLRFRALPVAVGQFVEQLRKSLDG